MGYNSTIWILHGPGATLQRCANEVHDGAWLYSGYAIKQKLCVVECIGTRNECTVGLVRPLDFAAGACRPLDMAVMVCAALTPLMILN